MSAYNLMHAGMDTQCSRQLHTIAAGPFTVITKFHARQHFQVTSSYNVSQPT